MSKRIICLAFATLVAVVWLAPAPAAAQTGVMFVKDNNVGVKESSPIFPLDVLGNVRIRRTDGGTSNIRFVTAGGTVARTWLFQAQQGDGAFAIRDVTGNATPFKVQAGAPANLFTLTAAGTVEISGSQVHPDYVFEPFYELESIDEHAAYMFENKHLPAVGAGEYNERGQAVIALGERSQGMLEELEKAHVYIAQLDNRLKTERQRNDELEARLQRLESRLSADDS